MSTVFTKIVNGEIPSYKIAENDDFYAFLDINPVAKGHTLVIPKQETDYIFDLDTKTLQELISFARPIAHAIDHALGTIRTGIIVEGLEVPHAHIHLIPIYSEDQIVALGQHKEEFTKDQMAEIANKIKEAL